MKQLYRIRCKTETCAFTVGMGQWHTQDETTKRLNELDKLLSPSASLSLTAKPVMPDVCFKGDGATAGILDFRK